MIKVTIIILHFNHQPLTEDCLFSIEKLAVKNFELSTIVVNNNPQEKIDSLKKKFPQIYDNNKTEWEMMQELGYDRIWDCGKFKYEMTF